MRTVLLSKVSINRIFEQSPRPPCTPPWRRRSASTCPPQSPPPSWGRSASGGEGCRAPETERTVDHRWIGPRTIGPWSNGSQDNWYKNQLIQRQLILRQLVSRQLVPEQMVPRQWHLTNGDIWSKGNWSKDNWLQHNWIPSNSKGQNSFQLHSLKSNEKELEHWIFSCELQNLLVKRLYFLSKSISPQRVGCWKSSPGTFPLPFPLLLVPRRRWRPCWRCPTGLALVGWLEKKERNCLFCGPG